MEIRNIIYLPLLLSIFLSSVATAAIDDNASVVNLRISCLDGDGSTLNNCFTGMTTLQNWVDNVRPNPNDVLSIEIGPGTWNTPFTCNSGRNITLRGSGRENTIINTTGPALLLFSDCNINVQDIKIVGTLNAITVTGGGVGVTTWTNVDVEGLGYGWSEGCSAGNQSKHFWFSSRIRTKTAFGLARSYSTCSENWFFGSEITTIATESNTEAVALVMAGSETHVYGSVVRAISEPGVTLEPASASGAKTVKGMVTVAAYDSEIHIHGTGIDLISAEPNDVIALLAADPASMVHTNASSFSLSTGQGGKITRIKNDYNADVSSPFMWKQSEEPPTNFVSQNGADMIVETKCDSTGCHPIPTQNETHLLIYNDSCNYADHGPWFDVVTGKCRGQN